MLTLATNLWGVSGGLEAQRQDLWRVSLQPAIAYFSTLTPEQFAAVGLNKGVLPNEDSAAIYATRVALPVQKLVARQFIQGTVKRNLPGYFESVDTARIDFLHEGGGPQSPIYTLFQIWRSIVRIGRQDFGGETTFLLSNASFKPQFKFDIILQLLAGDSTATESAQDLAFSAQYTLVNCWPRIIQQGAIDRTGAAQVHTLSVQFALQEVI